MKRISALFKKIIIKNYILFIFMITTIIIEGIFAAFGTISIAPIVESLIYENDINKSGISNYVSSVLESVSINPGLWSFIFIFFIFNLTRNLISIVTQYIILRIKYRIVKDIIFDAFNSFFKARWIFFCNAGEGKLLNTFLREITIIGDSFGGLARMIATVFQIFIYLFIPILVDWKSTVICLLTAGFLAIPINLLSKHSYKYGKRNTETSNEFSGVIQESITCAKVILGFGIQKDNTNRVINKFDEHVSATIPSQMLHILTVKLYEPLGFAALIMALYTAKNQGTTIGELAIVIWSLMRIIPLIGQTLQGKISIDNFFPSFEQFEQLKKEAKSLEQNASGQLFSSISKNIDLKNISYSYGENHKVLKNINVKINKGSITAFVGESGSGKSTLIDCIMGFLEPDNGGILVGNFLLKDIDITSYRKKIGYVSQTPLLFDMTVKDNFLIVDKYATDDEIWNACKKANADDFVSRLPKKLDTEVGARGVKLSGGQCQRLALARALLRNPELLILDEATSAIDSKSENLIQESINNLANRTTVILIAHRLSTVRDADYIYVFNQGEIIEEGSYEDLMRLDKTFKEMVDIQNNYRPA